MQLKKLEKSSDETIRSIHNLLIDAYPPGIRRYLIYSDINYTAYLSKIIDATFKDLFYIAEKDDNVIALVHFKILSTRNIFINNIIVKESYRGNNIGKLLLSHSLNDLENNGFETLSLDVFSSNTNALGWYKKMGMSIVKINNWYDVSPLFFTPDDAVDSDAKDYVISVDENGFSGIYIDELKIASLINNSTLIFRNAEQLFENIFLLKHLKNTVIDTIILISESACDFNIIEKSYQLSIELNKLAL